MVRARVGALGIGLLAGALAASTAMAQLPRDTAPRQLHAEPSALAQVIADLERAPPETQRELAMLIVEALVDAYESELDQALRDRTRNPSGQRRLSRWHQAAAPVLTDLRIAQANLYVARTVELHADRHGQILLLIDGRPLWVAWPRPAVQSRLEREVAAAFCRNHHCPTAEGGGAGHAGAPSLGVQGTWVLSQGRPPGWQTPDGLRCEFVDLSGRSAREAICQELALDLRALATALQAAQRGGERIEWAYLALHRDGAGDRHRIAVTEGGDYIAVAVPALAANPVDWVEARRWLRARVEGRTTAATILPAAGGR